MNKQLSDYSTFTQTSARGWDRLFNHVGPLNMPWVGYWLLYVGSMELLYQAMPGLATGIAGAVLLGSILVASGKVLR